MVGAILDDAADKVRAIKKNLKSGGASDDLLDFANKLFARGAREDLDRLQPAELAVCAKNAFEFLKNRPAQTPKIRVSNLDFSSLVETPVTVVDIVNDNMPFLLDSVIDLLQETGHAVRLVVHPIVTVKRDAKGNLKSYGDGHGRESVIHVHIDRMEAQEDRAELQAEIETVLAQVRVAVDDWRPMRERLARAISDFKASPPPIPVDEIAEAIQFLEWILDNNFTLLGMREYDYDDSGDVTQMTRIDATALGILRDPDVKVLRRGREMVTITPEIREFLRQSSPLIVTKANVRSRVHRRAYMDYIGIKIFDSGGQFSAELRVIGLFTSTAYTKSVQTIPYIRRKIDNVVRETGIDPGSHSGKALLNVLENYPRDELFQIDWHILAEFSMAIAQLEERPRIRVLARPDRFDRFVSVLAFVPRDRFNTDVRVAIGSYLAEVFEGRLSAYYPSYPEGPLARVHYIIGRDAGATPVVSQAQLEADIARLVRTWEDGLRDALTAAGDPSQARVVFSAYNHAFNAAYKEAFPPETAVDDIAIIERLTSERRLAIRFGRGEDADTDRVNLKIYHHGQPIPLSDRMPIIENMGFHAINERTYRIRRQTAEHRERVWLHDIALTKAAGGDIDLDALGARLEATFMAVWTRQAEDDGYAALTLNAGIPWRDVAILRALSRYLRQARLPYSQDYMWETMNRHPHIASKLVDYFHTRFNPDPSLQKEMREARERALLGDIESGLQAVTSLDEDQIIRRFLNLIQAMLRTNLFQLNSDGLPKGTFAFKFDPSQVEGLPEPRPHREIFVYSPRVEGVHLRGGSIARGGLRWSDRPQDFRTEILGLAKAQQVKNAVIVPVGAKGGFVPKQLPAGGSRDDVFNEGRESYKIFISSLLDVTDNLDGDTIVPPDHVTRLDGDDPYLVVAADKGTATFSDTANAISQDHGFWLDDAFASGGSAGYDHKKMGITARGGWEAVKRHFREMDIDIQSEPFTVIGCGDMSGDVFGNGMLLSKKIKLVAAFDHRDIFIDPDPDPAKTYRERKRLFDKGRSSWQDYNTKLISKGGGILSRSEKALTLTPEMQKLIGIKKTRVSPFELINAILKMQADLLWFGGIGTYVRSRDETDEMVGDRANDPVRVTAEDLNVKVVGEGANLGMTQKARIAFALNGGRINTDAIDNSAGVNSSDLEVNIKIALGSAVRDGRFTTPARNKLLAAMTDEVADLVLRNNYLQTLALSLAQRRGVSELEFQSRFMVDLESRGLLDRAVEDLPDAETLHDRVESGKGLARPELAVLLAYAKITVFDELLASGVPDEPYLARELGRYFPTRMKRKFTDTIEGHRLRREIIATMIANSMINRGGPVFVDRIADQTGANVAEIATAFALARDSYKMTDLNGAIDALDNKIGGDLQLALYERIQNVLWRQALWFTRNADPSTDLASQVARYAKGIGQLASKLDAALPDDLNAARANDATELAEAGVPADLAGQLADLTYLIAAPDIIRVAEKSGASVVAAAKVYFGIGDRFGTDRLARAAAVLDLGDYYDRAAVNRALDGVAEAQRRIAAAALANGRSRDPLAHWLSDAGAKVEKTRQAVSDIADDPALTVSKLSVASGLLRDLAPA